MAPEPETKDPWPHLDPADPEAYDPKWTDLACAAVNAGTMTAEVRSLDDVLTDVVAGACPRCTHRIERSTPREVVAAVDGDAAEEPQAAEAYLPIDVTCGCPAGHRSDDKQVAGCGVVFRVPGVVVA